LYNFWFLFASIGSLGRDAMIEYGKSDALSFDAKELGYILTSPKEIKEGEKLPLIVFLHGAGERGDNLEMLKCYCIPKLFTNNEEHEGLRVFTLSPQCPYEATWIDFKKELYALIDKICKEYPIDLDAVSLCGISMGGFGTWDLLMRHPDVFAAGVPICGGADTSYAEVLKDMPIYTAHGTWDGSVPYSGTEAMVKALIEAGNEKVIFKSIDRGSHTIWDGIAADPTVIEWLLEQSK
jgi:predicted peptidase